ncbi:hypothetical protein AB6O49_26165 [Streptomyces sp. SBR177]
MTCVDHEPGAWFLVEQRGVLHLDARYGHGALIDDSVLVRLDAAELAAYRTGGHAALSDLAARIHDSAPTWSVPPTTGGTSTGARTAPATARRSPPRSPTAPGPRGSPPRGVSPIMPGSRRPAPRLAALSSVADGPWASPGWGCPGRSPGEYPHRIASLLRLAIHGTGRRSLIRPDRQDTP